MRHIALPAAGVLTALLALPAALIDRRVAVALLVAATAAGILSLSGRHPRTARAGLVLTVLAALLTTAGFVEFHRPVSAEGPDTEVYGRPGTERTVTLPLTVSTTPITRLALLELEAGADPVYEGFEPQLIVEGGAESWRILAYRHDDTVDVFDEPGLDRIGLDDFSVIGEGLNEHVVTPLGDPCIDVDDQGRARIRAQFTDVEGREVRIAITETTARRSAPTALIAPVGGSSKHPTSFPLFVLHGFEFIREHGTSFDLTIDGRPTALAAPPVPFPMQGQLRSFAKYAASTEILEIFPTSETQLREVRTEPGSDRVVDGDVQYLFAGDALERILVGRTEIVFEPALDLSANGEGRLTITPPPGFGRLSGPWTVTADGPRATIDLGIDEVAVPRQRDLLYRAIVNRWSFFGTWPTKYRYRAEVDTERGRIDASWTNTDPLE